MRLEKWLAFKHCFLKYCIIEIKLIKTQFEFYFYILLLTHFHLFRFLQQISYERTVLMDSLVKKLISVSSVQTAVIATIFSLNLEMKIGTNISDIFMLC